MANELPHNPPDYLPALDGIRAVAVGAVVAYHLHVPFFGGGLLGVSVFFTLSGYLITSLLVREVDRSAHINLKAFWLRRARRLLPALLFMLPVVVITTAIAHSEKLANTAKQALFALLYVANWTTIARGDDYFERFAGPGPLDHLWSLAIEEQFYIVWPLTCAVLLALGHRLVWRRAPLAVMTLLFTALSTWSIVHLYDPIAINNTRAYEGTDARAASLLVGALAAILLPFDQVPKRISSAGARTVLNVVGVVGLVGILAFIARTDEYSPFLYRGGELALASATVLLTLASAHRETWMARLLAWSPLRWIGARSYGIYLWHLPIVAFMPASVLTSRPAVRALVQLALMVLIAGASYRWIEDPIRRRSHERGRVLVRALILLPIATLALVLWPLRFPPDELQALAAEPVVPPTPVIVEPPVPSAVASLSPVPPKVATTLLTSCRELVHVGDSTSIGLVSTAIIPNANDRLAARYRAVGVETFVPDISGARSMVETAQNQPNATDIVAHRQAAGYRGCYVIALGTNDPANTGGNMAALSSRIDNMMSKIGDKPVLWMTTRTTLDKGPYKNANSMVWNQALLAACDRHPTMRVYDWASEVKDPWFQTDGVHPNFVGYRERAARIAVALAHAFPKGESPSASCVVTGLP